VSAIFLWIGEDKGRRERMKGKEFLFERVGIRMEFRRK
jgi:hypothetical protein